jgi:hydrogenase nickel incorporation protein HypB
MNRVPLDRKVLSENDRMAECLRARFRQHRILCLNLISSPGAGKTSLLERTLGTLGRNDRVAVLTGDIQTDNDARRLVRFGFPVRQITTGGTCHLDARMVDRALGEWRLDELELLLIENVGNLVCPASYDLGENAKVVVLSVTEGDDKPLKYPAIFSEAELLVLNKTDLLPHVDFKLSEARNSARRINPMIEVVEVSCKTGEGFDSWQQWLDQRRETARLQCSLGKQGFARQEL